MVTERIQTYSEVQMQYLGEFKQVHEKLFGRHVKTPETTKMLMMAHQRLFDECVDIGLLNEIIQIRDEQQLKNQQEKVTFKEWLNNENRK